MVSLLGKGKVLRYIAEEPEKIIHYAENKIKDVEEKLKLARKLLPELKSIHKRKEKPIVKFYEGKEGMIQAFEDTLTAKETIVGYACGEPMYKALPGYFPEYFKRRAAQGISARVIAPDTLRSREIARYDQEELRESRLVPKEKFDLAIEINIYDNKVMIVSWEENLGILIESKRIAEAEKRIFELVWKGAKVISKGK